MSDAAPGNPFRYCGEYLDAETGLYYLRARYYDPGIGRFTSEDTREYINPNNPLSSNLYTYCYSNPLMFTDPGGHNPLILASAIYEGLLWLGGLLPGLTVASDPGVQQAVGEAVTGIGNAFDSGANEDTSTALTVPGSTAISGGNAPSYLEPNNNKPASLPWYNPDGTLRLPPNNGFQGTPTAMVLQPGARVDRYGDPNGYYVSPQGTPIAGRSLSPKTNTNIYTVYEVVKPIEVQAGEAAAWYGQPGGGTQYLLNQSTESLVQSGHLRRIQ